MSTDLNIEGCDGVRLHGVVSGEKGPAILFLHGFPEFWRAWHNQLAEFSTDHRAVALDMRGYNLSEKPPRVADYALSKLVADLGRVIESVSSDGSAVVVGHDWGGIAAWALARARPALVKRLVIINAPHPVLFFRELKQNGAQQLASSYAAFFQVPGLSEAALRAGDFALLRAMVFGTTSKPAMFSPILRAAYLEAWSQPGALTAGLRYYRNVRSFAEAVSDESTWRILVPTLVLWGEKDPALLRGNLVGLDDFVPDLKLLRHPAATHWIVHEEPAWVNDAIRSFITAG